jgi:hypothetical protein
MLWVSQITLQLICPETFEEHGFTERPRFGMQTFWTDILMQFWEGANVGIVVRIGIMPFIASVFCWAWPDQLTIVLHSVSMETV